MNDQTSWWANPVILGSITSLAVFGLSLLGIVITPAQATSLGTLIGQAAGVIATIVGVISAAISLWKGITTHTQINAMKMSGVKFR